MFYSLGKRNRLGTGKTKVRLPTFRFQVPKIRFGNPAYLKKKSASTWSHFFKFQTCSDLKKSYFIYIFYGFEYICLGRCLINGLAFFGPKSFFSLFNILRQLIRTFKTQVNYEMQFSEFLPRVWLSLQNIPLHFCNTLKTFRRHQQLLRLILFLNHQYER